jgi:hypothetical protein
VHGVSIARGVVAETVVGLPPRDHLAFARLPEPVPPRSLGGLGPLELRQLIQDAVRELSFEAIVAPIAQSLQPGTFLRKLLAQKV